METRPSTNFKRPRDTVWVVEDSKRPGPHTTIAVEKSYKPFLEQVLLDYIKE